MNWDILGNEWAVALLKGHIAEDTLRHAYLFSGPKGIGKRTLALRFTQALNCTNPIQTGEPCQECRTCRQIIMGQYPDLAIVEAGEKGGVLRVDQVRELQHQLALAPYQSKYRIAILLDFEDANPNASNALLKTLEEPPPQVILILTAQSSEHLLPTVVSRCEVLRLRSVSSSIIVEDLQTRWKVEPEKAILLAHLSDGSPGYAVSLLQNPETLAQRSTWLQDHLNLLAGNRVMRFAYADKLTKTREKGSIIELLHVWLSLWRDVFLQASGASVPITNLEKADEIKALARQHDIRTSQQVVSSLIHTLELLDLNINTRLAIENLMLDLP